MVKISGGDKLEAKLAEISQHVSKAAKVQVGFFEGSTYPDGTSVPLVAAINEFGQTRIHPHQPPRPFFRGMIKEHSGEWPETIRKLLAENDFDAARVLDLLGEEIAGQLQQSIVEFTTPGLAPSTIARKGFDKPLIDTGVLLRAIGHEVDAPGGGTVAASQTERSHSAT